MKSVSIALLTQLIIPFSVLGLDLHTDTLCVGLKSAVEQSQSIEQVQQLFEATVKEAQLSSSEQAILVDQVIAYTHKQREQVKSELAGFNSKSYDRTVLAKGACQLAVGAVSAGLLLNAVRIYGIYVTSEDVLDLIDILENLILSKLYMAYPSDDELYINRQLKAIKFVKPELCLHAIAAPYLLYKGGTGLYKSIHAQQPVEQKIANLDATISYFEGLKASL